MTASHAGSIVSGAHIEAEADFAGDDVACAGIDRELADRRDERVARAAAGHFLDHPDRFGDSGERVMAKCHRHRAGMAGLASRAQAVAALARDGGDHAERLSRPLQHRPLLDMDLEVADDVGAAIGFGGERRRIAAEGEQRIADLDARGIDQVEHGRLERTRHGRRAEQRFREAHPLLVAEGEDLDVERQAEAAGTNLLGGEDAGDDAEIAVIAARRR